MANDGRNGQCNPTVINCVFINNSADSGGGGALYNYYSNPTITNCIIWNNTGDDIFDDSSTPIVTYSILQTYISGTGCLTGVDPLFVDESDPDGPDDIWMTVDDGLRLSACSPAINAGDNTAVPPGITTDITSINPRIIDTIVDMGAYETATQPPGSGTSGDPYQISTFNHLMWVSNNSGSWGSYFVQTADIDASASSTCDGGAGFSPIGLGETLQPNDYIPFTGTYDGQYHLINGIYVTRGNYEGVFGYSSGTVMNLGVTNVDIRGWYHIGGLVGFNDGAVSECFSTGNVIGTDGSISGLVGSNYGTIDNCYSLCTVSGLLIVGGFVGDNENLVPSIIAIVQDLLRAINWLGVSLVKLPQGQSLILFGILKRRGKLQVKVVPVKPLLR